MDIDDLKLLLIVARTRSFAETARELEIDPSSVSRRISALEEEIGVRLLQRTTRSLSLTEAGHSYLADIRPILSELELANESVLMQSEQPSGRLKLTASIAFAERCIIPHLPALAEAYPDLEFELVLDDKNLNLVENGIDLAIRLGPTITGDLIISKFFDTQYHVCASPGYIGKYGAPEKPEELASRKCLTFALREYRTGWKFKSSRGSVREVSISSDIAISNALALQRATLLGLGPALLSDWLVRENLDDGSLIDLFPKHRATATNFETAAWFVYPSRNFVPIKVRVVMDYFRRAMGSRTR